jgi:hypothetical protein
MFTKNTHHIFPFYNFFPMSRLIFFFINQSPLKLNKKKKKRIGPKRQDDPHPLFHVLELIAMVYILLIGQSYTSTPFGFLSSYTSTTYLNTYIHQVLTWMTVYTVSKIQIIETILFLHCQFNFIFLTY